MPRYFFSFVNDLEVRDPVGTYLEDDRAAKQYAQRMRDDLEATTGEGNWKVRVTDENGMRVLEVYPHRIEVRRGDK